jgi:methylglyoxal synthase
MTKTTAPEPKRIALVAHDHRKGDLLEWADYNRDILAGHLLYATGTTGRLLGDLLDLPVTCFQSGPLGGDQQIGALIASGRLDMLVFFWDPMSPQPHDSDVKALVRIAVVWNIPIACNRTSADYLITSPLLGTPHAAHPPLTSALSLAGLRHQPWRVPQPAPSPGAAACRTPRGPAA